MERSMLLNIVLLVVIGAICANLSGCGQEMDLAVSYVCTDGSTKTETCKAWTQTGKITQEGKACFPEDAIVVTRIGHKKISEVQVGDELLGMDHEKGEAVFTKVRAWLHRNVHAESEMTVVETDAGSVIASPQHSIAVGRGGEYAFANDLTVGHTLLRADGSTVAIRKIRKQVVRGYYSPLTHTSNFFVGTSPQEMVLAHSFAHLDKPRRYETAVHGMMRFAELFSDSVHDVVGDDKEGYLHPVLQQGLRLAPLIGLSPDLHGDVRVVETKHEFSVDANVRITV